MKELLLNWVLTASMLIAVVLVLRAAFGKRISARLRYALWLAVLARLLIPGQFYTAPVETPQVFPAFQTAPAYPLPQQAQGPAIPADLPEAGPAAQTAPVSGGGTSGVSAAKPSVSPLALSGGVWLAGTLLTAAVFTASNIRFSRRLRKVRRFLDADAPLPVYTAAGLPSPCLFGVFRPAVYLTPEAAADSTALRHVLAHETTHFRHGDQIWSLLRCAALAVHWWNPLVWLAAVLSRRDAELACDEGALKRLGGGERQAYGNTLLTLVTAKPRPGDLLCCATTMLGGRKSLRERMRRIARAPERWLWAAVLTAVLAGLVCACSFAKPAESLPDSASGKEADRLSGPLSEEEMAYFNNEFFNGGGFNIHNQFLFLLANELEGYRNIDLYQLFYNGTGEPMEITDAERQAAADAAWNGEDPGVDLIKCPASEMDAVLRENLGLSLEETEKRGLDRFTYLPEYDAYYSFHGDTNYPGDTVFLAGQRMNGKIDLYYSPGFLAPGGNWPVTIDEDGSIIPMDDDMAACVTLEEQPDGGYRFLSNTTCELFQSPTAFPDWAPERTISLDSLTPYQQETPAIQKFSGEVRQFLTSKYVEMPNEVEFWRATDGYTYASIQPGYADTKAADYFLRFPYSASAEQIGVIKYTGICGQNGFKLTYPIAMGTYVTDYYYYDAGKRLQRLVCDTGVFIEIDLDGDGQRELLWSPNGYGDEYLYLLYQREGRFYKAELKSLIREAWPEAGYISGYGFGSGTSRFISMAVEVPLEGADFTVSAYRTVWFDGENLRIYKDETPYENHFRADIEAPAVVEANAWSFVNGVFRTLAEKGTGTTDSGEIREGQMVWDDWRITGLRGPYYETVGTERIEIWNVSYETHTTTPERIILAGGSYIGEDGWAMIGYPGCDYLCFRLDEEGYRSLLFTMMENDCGPGTELFKEDLVREMKQRNQLMKDLSSVFPPEA